MENEDYEVQAAALAYALDANPAGAGLVLRKLTLDELDMLINALDELAAWADAEAIRRVEKRA